MIRPNSGIQTALTVDLGNEYYFVILTANQDNGFNPNDWGPEPDKHKKGKKR
jgi:hypothetical protein